MKNEIKELRELKKSFLYALKGFFYCIKNERNMRIHIVFAVFMFTFSLFFKLTGLEYAVLFLTIGMVIFCEIINTAIEALVNLSSPAYNSLAKVAKDVAAGGVFLSSIVAVFVGIALFGKPEKLNCALCVVFSSWHSVLLFVLILGFGILFIFKSFKLKISNKAIGVDEVKIYKPKKNKNFNFKY